MLVWDGALQMSGHVTLQGSIFIKYVTPKGMSTVPTAHLTINFYILIIQLTYWEMIGASRTILISMTIPCTNMEYKFTTTDTIHETVN